MIDSYLAVVHALLYHSTLGCYQLIVVLSLCLFSVWLVIICGNKTCICVLLLGLRYYREYTHYFFHCYSALPKCHSIGKALQVQSCVDSGLNCIVQLIKIRCQAPACGGIPFSPNLLVTCMVAFLDSCLDKHRLQRTHRGLGHETGMGGHV